MNLAGRLMDRFKVQAVGAGKTTELNECSDEGSDRLRKWDRSVLVRSRLRTFSLSKNPHSLPVFVELLREPEQKRVPALHAEDSESSGAVQQRWSSL